MSATTGGPCPYCKDTRTELRRRLVGAGSVQIVHQCLTCGCARSTPVKSSSVRNPNALPNWDESLGEKFGERVNLENQAQRDRDRDQFFREHDAYLQTPEWHRRRRLVMLRAGGRCEGCREADATQVHHLTYDHWKEEFLWELVAICKPCHDRIHHEKKV